MPHVLAIILARAGSQGLTDKHRRPLLSRPVIEYTFDAALAAAGPNGPLSQLLLSTDCPHLRRLAAARGIESIERPPDLATSTATVQDSLLHALDTVEAAGHARAHAVVLLYGNVPVRPPAVIERCASHLLASGCDSVRTFCPVGKWHPAWMSRLEADRVVPLEAGSIDCRQDLAPLFLHDGACIAMSRESLLRGVARPHDPHAMFGDDRRGVIVGEGQTVEIDCERDLYLAQAVLRARAAHLGSTALAA